MAVTYYSVITPEEILEQGQEASQRALRAILVKSRSLNTRDEGAPAAKESMKRHISGFIVSDKDTALEEFKNEIYDWVYDKIVTGQFYGLYHIFKSLPGYSPPKFKVSTAIFVGFTDERDNAAFRKEFLTQRKLMLEPS